MDKLTVPNREKKAQSITSLEQKIKDAKSIIFADYRGLTVNQISDLRNKIKNVGGELLVAKNTLLYRALNRTGLATKLEDLAGPTATVFSFDDEIEPVKILAENAKTLGFPSFKFGFLAGNIIDAPGVERLAKIPAKNALQAQIVGSLSSPLWGIVSVIQSNLRNLVSVLDQASKKQAAN